jgi:hypothetical protein
MDFWLRSSKKRAPKPKQNAVKWYYTKSNYQCENSLYVKSTKLIK